MDRAGHEKVHLSPFDKPEIEVVRFTLARELKNIPRDRPLPFGYRVEPWVNSLIPAFAAVLAVTFSNTPEIQLYPRLASRDGCREIMKELVAMPNFLTGASWVVLFNKEPAAMIASTRSGDVRTGKIEVLAVAPRHQRSGVGTHILIKALWAFKDHHSTRVEFRTNRNNRKVIRFFRSAGFHVDSSETFL